MKDSASLMFEWRSIRLKLKDGLTEDNLQEMTDWFFSLNPSVHGFNYDDMKTWPDIWRYISEEFYTESGNGLGMFYTLVHADYKPELWLIHDLYHSDIYLVCIIDDYVLNRKSGKVEKLSEVRSDLDVLEKHTSDNVMETIKFN